MTCNEKDFNDLIKRIKLLELENDELRKENEILKKKSRTSINVKENKSLVNSNTLNKILPIFNNKTKGCTCKGNCSNKICGCVKKNLQCNETCKCNAVSCKNKEKDKENRNVNRSLPIPKERKISLDNKNGNTSKNINKIELIEKNSHHQPMPTCSHNNDDDVFNDSLNSNLENPQINAVKKLTFISDEDTIESRDIELSAIEEIEEHEQSMNDIRKQSPSDYNKMPKNSSSYEIEKKDKNHSKLTIKAKKSLDSNKNESNSKISRKASKSKRTESDNEMANKSKVPNVTLRSRQTKTSNNEKMSEQLNLESIKSTGVTSCIKSVSNLKQPKNWNSGSSLSLNNDDSESSPRLTRSKRINGNSSRDVVTTATNAAKTSLKKGNGLRRSFSSDAICVERNDTQRKRILNRSSSTSRESLTSNNNDKTTRKSFNRSLSNENLSKRKSLISKVKHSFRRSKSTDNVNHGEKFASTHLTELLQVTDINDTSEKFDKSLKFDPMQPTHQLSRSPIPPVVISSETSESSISHSPPIFSRFLNSQDIPISSPPPEILQDLNEVEVDPDDFQSKLVICRKCKRSFFPHRITLHEAICSKK